MNELVLPIMLGIISSLVATPIFIVLSWVIKNVVLPWYSDQVYKGVRLNGEWARTNVGGTECCSVDHPLATLSLKQKGEYVSGTYTHGSNASNSKTPLEEYIVKGNISNSFLVMTKQPLRNDNIDAASGIYHIFNKDHKLQLRGSELCIESENVKIHAFEGIVFTKNT